VSDQTRALILKHWELANGRHWSEFQDLLAQDFQYEVPQTREYIETGEGYFDMFRTWPGNWKATIKHLVCDGDKAVCVIDFDVADEKMTGISVFELKGGKLAKVTDYWPEPYDPPARVSSHMKRRASAA
jgi:hypothetical protein